MIGFGITTVIFKCGREFFTVNQASCANPSKTSQIYLLMLSPLYLDETMRGLEATFLSYQKTKRGVLSKLTADLPLLRDLDQPG